MQDFLKDRPTLTPEEAKMIAPAPAAAGKSGNGPFARIVRDESFSAPRAAAPTSAKGGPVAKPVAPAAHTSQVKTVVENGRITGLVVTCSCGKVTEIACVY
jgi:hypothetical protein